MSWAAQAWAVEQHPGGVRKAVLMALAYCINHETGICNPRLETLCEMTDFSRSAVGHALDALVAEGYIEREREPGKLYEYSFPALARGGVAGTPPVGREEHQGGVAETPQEPEENHNPLSVSENALQDGLFVLEDSLTDVSLPGNGTNGAVAEVYAYWRERRHKTRSNYDRISPARADKIRLRLKEFTVDDLRHAIDGVGCDPWPDRERNDDITVIFRSHEQVDKFLELWRDPPRKPGKDESGMIARAMAEHNRLRGRTSG